MKKVSTLIFIFCVACSSVNIKGVTKEDDFAIAKYKTFSFFEVITEGDAIGQHSQENLKLLKEAIARQMKAKGLALSGDNPDLLVNIGIVVAEQVQTRETSFSQPGDRTYYMNQRSYSWQSQQVEVGKYREGTVIVHLVDRQQNKLVWQGSADSVLPEKQKNVPAVIEEAMTKLFEKVQ